MIEIGSINIMQSKVNIDQEISSETKIPLLTRYKKYKPTFLDCFLSVFCSCFNKRVIEVNRKFHDKNNYTPFDNIIKNQKYNIFTLIPFVFINQFSLFSNQFYLLMAFSQFFDELKVGFLFSYIAPLAFVLLVTLIKESIDDFYRYRRDQETNNARYNKITLEGKKIIKSRDIKIGDVLEIHQNENVPADMIILKSFEENAGGAFIRTDQLDGETDWKLRKAPPSTQKYDSIYEILAKNFLIVVDPPEKKIYEFNGVLIYHQKTYYNQYNNNAENNLKNNDIENKKEEAEIHDSLSLENTLWSNTVLASQKVVGIVIYTGKETRSQMNSALPRSKIGILDLEINKLSKILFFIMILCSIIMIILRGLNMDPYNQFIGFFRFLVLFCSIIPISLRTNLDISKTKNSADIEENTLIPETLVRNSSIPEELGRIQYIFSDKTGTLTNNIMKLKKLSLEIDQFSEESISDLKLILEDECKNYDFPSSDLILLNNKLELYRNSIKNNNLIKENEEDIHKHIPDLNFNQNEINDLANFNPQKRIRRNRGKIIRDTITAMAICNNVTPVKVNEIFNNNNSEDGNYINNKISSNFNIQKKIINFNYDALNESYNSNEIKYDYQASSPDEVSLVNFCEQLKMRLIYRTDKIVKMQNANNVIEEYEILANFPFSSETKRMGIIVRNLKSDQIIFYSKGAENVIEEFVKEDYKSYIKENSENLASLGLRTLVITQKILNNNFYEKWIREYNNACISMENRKEKINTVIKQLENNMEFLTVTGVEDQLQEEVNETIDSLKNAGIKIWMLTGDKVETALCIAISTGLKSKDQKVSIIRENNSYEYIKNSLEKMRYIGEFVFVIDGICLEVALTQLEKLFFEIASQAAAVVCCRCSPTQKARIVRNIKKYTNKRTLAIGDGGNDVAMIQEADIGIGLVGKEGKQASLAADFSLTKFKHLNFLLLWFGRLSYKNTATISKFVIHRGLIISFIQFIFSIVFYSVSVPIYNGNLILGYTSIYTALPVISLLFDKDTHLTNVMKFPTLYKQLQRGRELSIKRFIWMFWKSLFQATVIMLGSIFLFETSFLKIATITFTCLIFAELLNVYTEIKTFHKVMVISLLITLLSYILSLIFLKEILDFTYLTAENIFKILLVTFTSWTPFFLTNKIKRCIYPEVYEKLNKIQIKS